MSIKAILIPPLLFLGLASCVSIAVAQSIGTFAATGNLTTPRFWHTATLLADGRVLIAGGATDNYNPMPFPPLGHAITAAAELYDPAAGRFTPTGNMITARAFHTATLLPDGRVLIAGGRGPGHSEDNLASAELYDPATGAFTATGNMIAPSIHDTNTATLLPSGRVLITGAPSRAELYDPDLGAFAATDNLTAPPSFATATLLADGRVLLAALFEPKIYDPATGTFSLTGSTGGGPAGRAAMLTNGNVLITGGNDDPGPFAGAELYDPSTEMFTATGNMTAPRANHTATFLPDGKALIAGGSSWIITTCSGRECGYYSCCLSSVELYDPATGLFANTGPMAAARAGHTATLLNNGKVLIAGGGGGGNTGAVATAELYSPTVLIPPPVVLLASGNGQGAILHASTQQLASPDNPAVAGEALEIFLTGLTDGSVIPPQVAVGGRMAEILFFGQAPGFEGLNQVNVRVPSSVVPGPSVTVRLTYLGRPSNEVTIGLN